MAAFQYEAIDGGGRTATGQLDASSRAEAVRLLSRRGLQPRVVSAVDEKARTVVKGKAAQSKAQIASTEAGIPVTLKVAQVIHFTEELSDLLHAGLQLEQALHSMEGRSSPIMRVLAIYLREQVRDGVPFSSALQQASPSFGDLYCSLVAAGEASGSLTSILKRQSRYLNAMESVRAKVSAALIYPSFIVVAGIMLAIMFSTYLLPKLTTLIQSTGGKIPPLASFLLAMNGFLKSYWWILLGLLFATIVGVKAWLKDPVVLKQWHKIQLDLPILGPLWRTRFEVQFLETLGNLLHNGLPLNRALELMRRITPNLHLKEGLSRVEAMVADGGSLSRSLEKTGIARPLVIDMIRVGEQTGEMAEALGKAGERFDRELTRVMERVTAMIQPVIIVVMAVLVGTMAWMMISVIYGTLENMRKH